MPPRFDLPIAGPSRRLVSAFTRPRPRAPRALPVRPWHSSSAALAPEDPATIPPVIPHPHEAFTNLASTLSTSQPCFGTRGDEVEILETPTAFHDRLLEMVKNAKKRILISSLYIGVEEESLVDAVTTALQSKPHLRATFVLDYNRATRIGRGAGPASTVHMLLPLLERFGDRVDVWLYRSPKLRGPLEKIVPPRFNEGWGTWHAKFYAVDDDVVLSGANLAASYFTNRQDRYIHIKHHPSLLSYLSSITRLISDYSYKVHPNVRPGTLGPHGVTLEPGTAGALWRERSLEPRAWAPHAKATISAFQQAWRASNGVRARDAREDGADTWFWPVIQAGVLGIREEESALGNVWHAIRMAGDGAVDVDLTSGYFGLYKAYKQAVIDSPAQVRVIAASPKVSREPSQALTPSRTGSTGPRASRASFQRGTRCSRAGSTTRAPRTAGCGPARGRAACACRSGSATGGRTTPRVGALPDETTADRAGMWLSPPAEDPFFTFIGSSNLSTRSLNLDTELSLLLATSSTGLRSALGKEIGALREYAHDVDGETWKLEERRVSLLAKALVFLGVEGML
ncbi:CDP-diacylglycerol--glycerol-3-phosphate 3-phosphatidyltransferase [Vanrija albida]|uniref:CDP-diacylglycerol--glycerol-3-phosphate 3-phosphatidyltransferase n=1 Tax=Vanrija albida TaxID=181172 RepID=A0ABR3QEC0_9TREE